MSFHCIYIFSLYIECYKFDKKLSFKIVAKLVKIFYFVRISWLAIKNLFPRLQAEAGISAHYITLVLKTTSSDVSKGR